MSKPKKSKAAKAPKQKRLPGTEDAEIEELQGAAEEYAGIRDKRMKLTEVEVSMKATLLATMKRHGKAHYMHEGVEITVKHEKETVKVKIHKDKEEE